MLLKILGRNPEIHSIDGYAPTSTFRARQQRTIRTRSLLLAIKIFTIESVLLDEAAVVFGRIFRYASPFRIVKVNVMKAEPFSVIQIHST